MLNNPSGDCFARCIAFALGDDPSTSSIPRPESADVELAEKIEDTRLSVEYYTKLGEWIHQRGYHAVCVPLSADPGWSSFHWDLESGCHPLVVVGGPREGDRLGHSVVWAGIPGQPGSTLIFNPSTSNLKAAEDLTFLVQIWPRLK